MFKYLQIMCVKYYELSYTKFALFSLSSLNDKKLIKQQT